MTQESLAEQLDMTPGGVQKWLAGTRQPSIDDINHIAVILGVAPAWLTHGVTAEDLLTDLPDEARATLRRFVRACRAHTSQPAVWKTLDSLADATLGPAPADTYDPLEHERLTRLIDGAT